MDTTYTDNNLYRFVNYVTT